MRLSCTLVSRGYVFQIRPSSLVCLVRDPSFRPESFWNQIQSRSLDKKRMVGSLSKGFAYVLQFVFRVPLTTPVRVFVAEDDCRLVSPIISASFWLVKHHLLHSFTLNNKRYLSWDDRVGFSLHHVRMKIRSNNQVMLKTLPNKSEKQYFNSRFAVECILLPSFVRTYHLTPSQSSRSFCNMSEAFVCPRRIQAGQVRSVTCGLV